MKGTLNASRRRSLGALALLPLFAAGVPSTAAGAVPKRVGWLWPGGHEDVANFAASGSKVYAAHGWIEGKTIEFIWRFTEGDPARIPALARELVGARPDVLVTGGTACTRALQQLTRTIPICTYVDDPVRLGFAKSLARPGGNITGLSMGADEIAHKQIELLRATVPKLATLAILGATMSMDSLREVADPIVVAAKAAGLATSLRAVTSLQTVETALRALQPAGHCAAYFWNILYPNPGATLEVAIRLRVPAMVQESEFVSMGGLLCYTLRHEDDDRSSFAILDRLLRGADPATIPFELPTKSIFAINRRTAAAIGVTFPPDFLLRADEVID
jgi:putative tryptophan/tyrosine transport system substrate-binding protein